MIYWLVNLLTRSAPGSTDGFFVSRGLSIRIICAGTVSALLVFLFGPRTIRFLMRKKIGDRPEFHNADLNALTRHKSHTPTMGGALMVGAIFFSLLLFGNLGNMYIYSGLFALVWLGLLGGFDDWMKLRRASGASSRDGLKSWEKLLFQIALAVVLSRFVYHYGSGSFVPSADGNPAHSFFFPFTSASITLPFVAYAIIMVLVTVGSSNAVNLTDGMDGLAAGNLIIVTALFFAVSWICGVQVWAQFFGLPFVPLTAEMTVLCASMLGALIGFMWFNAAPAAVFMGDTGSLPLGGLLGYIAVITRQEILLLIAGGVFVMEAGSVMLQVGYYKYTKRRTGGLEGKRLFRCAPIHHHFHLGGWPETKVVIRFWILGLLFAALALGTLKFR